MVLARRNAANWYVGAIFAGPGLTISTPLSFLGTGTWLADVYQDGSLGLVLNTRQVTNAGTLSVTVPTNGGFSVVLCPATPGATSCG